MTDLSTIPTPDLVRELEKRERDCQCMGCISKNMTFTGSIRDIERDIGFQIPGSYGTIQGPAKIIVVRGDE